MKESPNPEKGPKSGQKSTSRKPASAEEKSSPKHQQKLSWGGRTAREPSSRWLLTDAVKSAAHPVRSQILKALKDEPKSAIELEEDTGRSRYDLYHHLSVLEASGLVSHRLRDGKTKEFSLVTPSRPNQVVLLFNRDDLKGNAKALRDLVRATEALEDGKVPHKAKISGVQIIFSFPWSPDQ